MIRLKINTQNKTVTLLEVKLEALNQVDKIVRELDPKGWRDWKIVSEVEYISTQPYTQPWVAPIYPYYTTGTDPYNDHTVITKTESK